MMLGWRVELMTVNGEPLLGCPATVTRIFPVVAPKGTGAVMAVALQLVGVVVTPLNVTVLDPCVEPKFPPVMVTGVPRAPKSGESEVINGTVATVKKTGLLGVPTVTTTLPEVTPLGAGTTTLVVLQLDGVAVTPLNVTVLDPWVDPKFVPLIVTEVPATPMVGDI
jgi:hypothetical protein